MRKFPLVLLVIGFVFLFLSIDVTFTGAVTETNVKVSNSVFFIIGLAFFIVSLGLLAAGKSLESLLIPTGTKRAIQARVETAMKDYEGREEKPYILIAGEIHRDERGRPEKDTQQALIYKELRERGLKPSDFIIEGKSRDTLENFLYSIEKLKEKGIGRMKISTNPT